MQAVKPLRTIPPLLALGAVFLAATAFLAQEPAGFWKDIDGNPLPFQSPEAIREFLRTADIQSIHEIPLGVTAPRRVVLEKDGVRAEAALRDFEETYIRKRFPDGEFFTRLRDSFVFDLPAYELSRILELDNIPPVSARRIGADDITLQIWMVGAMMETNRIREGIQPPDILFFRRQQNVTYVFDSVIGNKDRNTGNILFDADWNFWLIDHSRSFQLDDETRYLEHVIWCERGLFERLKNLDREEVRRRLDTWLTSSEIDWMFRRLDKVIAYIEGLIAERGESAVLFEWK